MGSKGNSLSSQSLRNDLSVIKTQGTWLILGIKPSGTKLHGYFKTKMPSLSVSLFLLQCSKMSTANSCDYSHLIEICFEKIQMSNWVQYF